jgi:hypothetical protein
MKYYQIALATASTMAAIVVTAHTSPEDPIFYMSGALAVMTAGLVAFKTR